MSRTKAQKKKEASAEVKGWTAIAAFLAIPVSTAHRWARDGMPVRREGRFTVADPQELRAFRNPGTYRLQRTNASPEGAYDTFSYLCRPDLTGIHTFPKCNKT